jgi:DNA-directed RNA polymerase
MQELRESFIDLYEHPILENLKDSIERRYPDVEIPQLPKRGSLDIKLVAQSDYFFH